MDYEIEKIIDLYKSGVSANKIGKMINKDHHFVQNILLENNIILRSKRQSHIAGFPFSETSISYGNKNNKYGIRKVYKDHNENLFIFRTCIHSGLKKRIRVNIVKCNCCQKEFAALKSNNNKSKKRACSPVCKIKMQSGENNANWTGGRKTKSTGYILAYAPNNPNARKKFVLEHRLIMEDHLGRYLNENEFIHHINAVKNDNRLENLVICSKEEHIVAHGSINDILKDLIDNNNIYFDKKKKIYLMVNK